MIDDSLFLPPFLPPEAGFSLSASILSANPNRSKHNGRQALETLLRRMVGRAHHPALPPTRWTMAGRLHWRTRHRYPGESGGVRDDVTVGLEYHRLVLVHD